MEEGPVNMTPATGLQPMATGAIMTPRMERKPRHLSADYAAQFSDPSVVAAYSNRPPYPDEVFDTLASLLPSGPRRVLELGCGTGDLTLGLASRVAEIDAVDPSEAMVECARRRASGVASNIRWIRASAEDYRSTERYALVVAAESLHWMAWTQVLQMISRSLRDGGSLAIVTERKIASLPWMVEARSIVAQHSTNKDYRPYDVIEELSRRSLFREIGRRQCTHALFSQSVDAYVEAFHSRNGFSRDRMSRDSATDFDAAMRDLVLAYVPTGIVTGTIETTVVWGQPSAA
jgi:ubiquinone/menaquinone biosynthesis C-methylase UbiE